jgi:hypothetical protein
MNKFEDMGWIHLAQVSPVAGCCDHDKDTSASTKGKYYFRGE